MFFVLSKTIGLVVLPIVLATILFALFVLLRHRRPRLAWALFWVAFLGLYALSTRPVADLLLLPLEGRFEDAQRPRDADAIVVLGGTLNLGRSTTERAEMHSAGDRLLEAVLLAKQMPNAVLIFSGGSGDLFDQSKREAPLLKVYAVRLGIPEDRIRVDDRSRNTHENAVETKRILDAEGARSVVLVTSAYHMRRALGCFHAIGLAPIPCAVDFQNCHPSYRRPLAFVPGAENLVDSTSAIREYVGLVVYSLRGYM